MWGVRDGRYTREAGRKQFGDQARRPREFPLARIFEGGDQNGRGLSPYISTCSGGPTGGARSVRFIIGSMRLMFHGILYATSTSDNN